jgi:tRNA (adenine22-N1)-methyltransferase
VKEMKLKKRLSAIKNMILHNASNYKHIWDTCCDHGHLGFHLLSALSETSSKHSPKAIVNSQSQCCIHFVDIVPTLMQNIEVNLQKYAQATSRISYQVHCLSTADLPLNATAKNDAHLIIIAGVGGELLLQLVHSLLMSFPTHSLEFILCPVHHICHVRQGLQALKLGLVDEQLLQENNRFYEILYVSNHRGEKISPIGEKIWQSNTSEQKAVIAAYLKSCLQHYQRMQAHDSENQTIVQLYQNQRLST